MARILLGGKNYEFIASYDEMGAYRTRLSNLGASGLNMTPHKLRSRGHRSAHKYLIVAIEGRRSKKVESKQSRSRTMCISEYLQHECREGEMDKENKRDTPSTHSRGGGGGGSGCL